ncbi:MAG: hypothetical protein ACI92G_001580 [Candidatus Pelagisphaera sp.]|jgi:hypothetical protein
MGLKEGIEWHLTAQGCTVFGRKLAGNVEPIE